MTSAYLDLAEAVEFEHGELTSDLEVAAVHDLEARREQVLRDLWIRRLLAELVLRR
jgi:hypothetical protein